MWFILCSNNCSPRLLRSLLFSLENSPCWVCIKYVLTNARALLEASIIDLQHTTVAYTALFRPMKLEHPKI